MLSLMLSLMLAVASPVGVWEVENEGDSRPFYLVIHDRDDVRVFRQDWYPCRVRMSKWEGNTLKVDYYPSDNPMMLSIEAELSGDSIEGLLRVPTVQFTHESKVRLQRKSNFPYPEPWVILEGRERNQTIDLVGFLLERAPMDSFESFHAFWENDFTSRYYYFLYPLLEEAQGEAPGSEKEKVRKVYQTLRQERERLEEVKSKSRARMGYTAVLVPDLGQSGLIDLPITSYKIPHPPGVKICCGMKTHDVESFQLVKISLE